MYNLVLIAYSVCLVHYCLLYRVLMHIPCTERTFTRRSSVKKSKTKRKKRTVRLRLRPIAPFQRSPKARNVIFHALRQIKDLRGRARRPTSPASPKTCLCEILLQLTDRYHVLARALCRRDV